MKAVIYRIFTVAVMLTLLISLVACGGKEFNADDNGASPSGEDVNDISDTLPPVNPPVWSDSETSPEAEPPIQIAASEARALLQDWLDDHPIEPPDILSPEYGEHDEDGESYYLFSLDNRDMYWANFLVHKETGDLLFMMISDGEEPEIYTEPLRDWYDKLYGTEGDRVLVAYVRIDPSEATSDAWLLIDELLWINGDDLATLNQYGIDEDDVYNDYVLINEVVEWEIRAVADDAVFRVEFNQGDYEEWFNRRELGRDEFIEYVTYVMDNTYEGTILAEVTIDEYGLVTKVAERYVP